MSTISFGSNDNVVFHNATSKDLQLDGDNITSKMTTNDGSQKFAIKNSDNTELWSVDSSGTVTDGSSGSDKYVNLHFLSSTTGGNPVSANSDTNIFSLVTPTVTSSGFTFGSNTVTYSAPAVVVCSVVVGDNTSSFKEIRLKAKVGGTTVAQAEGRHIAGESNLTLQVTYFMATGTSLEITINGANSAGNNIRIYSINCSVWGS